MNLEVEKSKKQAAKKLASKARKLTSEQKQFIAHDHSSELKRLSRIKGQVEGVAKMIVDRRYCPDIIVQIKAVRSALRSLEANIIENHMKHCVRDAMASRNPQVIQQKLDEIVLLIKGQG